MHQSETIRKATPEDAELLVDLIEYASEGLAPYIWSKMAEPGESVRDVGLRRARREEGAFSYRNAFVLEKEGDAAAALIGYALPEEPEPIDYDSLPALFVPPQELENLVPGTWYVNVLAAYPQFRGQGCGKALLDFAEGLAREAGCAGLSIIVSDANPGARRLYERQGCREIARRVMEKEDWENEGQHWVLLGKRF
jgi:ribosomal protein S18 acetylase RimI-like enzyme